MKRIKKRRRRLRIGNPLGFTLLCIVCLIIIGGLYLGVSWCVKNGPELVEAFRSIVAETEPTATPEPVPTPDIFTPSPSPNAELDTPVPATADPSTPTPSPVVTDPPVITPDPNLSLYGYTIGLDPCRDKGSKYSAECAYNLEFALYLKEYLESEGATVVLTRESNDVSVSNDKRASIVKDANCDIALRLMCNEIAASSSGCYVKSVSKYKEFGQALIDSYSAVVGIRLQPGKANGLETASDSMASSTGCPCVLLIMGNWANKSDRAILKDSAMQEKMAAAICRVLIAQLGA